jgi:hypothetical protein
MFWWLPELVSQSVLRDVFEVRLQSLMRWARNQIDHNRAEAWSRLLATGEVRNRADMARREGLSRARVSQVLATTS